MHQHPPPQDETRVADARGDTLKGMCFSGHHFFASSRQDDQVAIFPDQTALHSQEKDLPGQVDRLMPAMGVGPVAPSSLALFTKAVKAQAELCSIKLKIIEEQFENETKEMIQLLADPMKQRSDK